MGHPENPLPGDQACLPGKGPEGDQGGQEGAEEAVRGSEQISIPSPEASMATPQGLVPLDSSIRNKCSPGDFPGCQVVKTLPSNSGDVGLIPGRGAKIPHALQTKQCPLQKTETIL